MGHAKWDPSAWADYAKATRGKSRSELFTSTRMKAALNPAKIKMRESRDSDDNLPSTPIIVGIDVTGSMGVLAETLVKRGLKPLFEEILDRKPVTDPHVMAMAIGDAWCDRAPLQVTQFEADISVAEQIQDLFIEGGGGANQYESYNLPWYFAATKTATDAWQKRGKKGYLFTVGDEPCPPVLEAAHIKKVFGTGAQRDLSTADVLAMAERQYEVFHVVVEEGSFARGRPDIVMRSWTEVLGQRVLRLSDHQKLSEVIVSAIEITEGKDASAVAASWTGDTSLVVDKAVKGLTVSAPTDGVVRF
jgi:hypothetical protein